MNVTEQFLQNKGTFEIDLETQHHFSDGLYAKEMHIPKGYAAGMHKHEYSHFSILSKGRVIVRTDEYNNEYTAPACIDIKAGINHTIEALEDTVWFCIHATEETDITKIDEVLIAK